MKKLISMLLALAMVLSLTAVTFATEASAAEAPSLPPFYTKGNSHE